MIEAIITSSTKNFGMSPTPDFRIYHAPEIIEEPMEVLEKLLHKEDYQSAHPFFNALQESMRATLSKMLSKIPAGVNRETTPPRKKKLPTGFDKENSPVRMPKEQFDDFFDFADRQPMK